MIYNERSIFIVYLISAILLSGLIYVTYYMNVGDILHGGNMKGTISAFWGVNPPEGWVICNGQTVNGIQTPDLRGKFVFGGSFNSQNFLSDIRNKNISTNNDTNIYKIEGGNNYQTLTNKVINMDPYIQNESQISAQTVNGNDEVYDDINNNFDSDLNYAYQYNNNSLFNSVYAPTIEDMEEIDELIEKREESLTGNWESDWGYKYIR